MPEGELLSGMHLLGALAGVASASRHLDCPSTSVLPLNQHKANRLGKPTFPHSLSSFTRHSYDIKSLPSWRPGPLLTAAQASQPPSLPGQASTAVAAGPTARRGMG